MLYFLVNCDGGARGNPGPAGIGVLIKIKNQSPKLKAIEKISKFIGESTNNQAEYQAVLEALKYLKKYKENKTPKDLEIEFLLDSELIVKQMNGEYKIKNEGLKPIYWQLRELIMELGGKVSFKHIPREKNKEADALVNNAIDDYIKKSKFKYENY